MIEIGGTVGDIESLPFLEAIRQLGVEYGRDAMFMHLTLVPFLRAANEIKTKPTQHSVKELRSIGIQPDVLLCRSEIELNEAEREKIALFTNVPTQGGDHRPGCEELHLRYPADAARGRPGRHRHRAPGPGGQGRAGQPRRLARGGGSHRQHPPRGDRGRWSASTSSTTTPTSH